MMYFIQVKFKKFQIESKHLSFFFKKNSYNFQILQVGTNIYKSSN